MTEHGFRALWDGVTRCLDFGHHPQVEAEFNPKRVAIVVTASDSPCVDGVPTESARTLCAGS